MNIPSTAPICGRPHVHHDIGEAYRSVEIASEPITDENWREMPDNTIYEVDENFYLLTKPLLGIVPEAV